MWRDGSSQETLSMRKYVLLFALLVLLANLAYALAQLGTGKEKFISMPLLLGSLGGAAVGLIALRKRLRHSKRTEKE
jgi:uncharacterized membrane protein